MADPAAAGPAPLLEAPTPPSARRQRQPIITLRMDEVEEELQQRKAGTPRRRAGAPRPAVPESLLRFVSFCRFCWTCATGACASLAPPTLAAAEALCMLLVYLLATPKPAQYSFQGSAEDVVALSLLRCGGVTLAHALGGGPCLQRPYLLTALLFAALSLPLGLMKLAELRHSQWAHSQWPPFIALYAAHMGFAVAQVLAAQRISEWARNRWEHGLSGFGWPLAEGEEAWLLAGQLQAQAEEGAAGRSLGPGGDAPEEEADVAAEQLADPDSHWVECGGLRVHYKLAIPLGFRGAADTGVVLVHSFGGGTFAWRHIQQPLADACGLPVLTFDRPGFGLTERPPPVPPDAPLEQNPYGAKAQALLTLQVAAALGLRRVVLAGHADGALLALMAAAMVCREATLCSPLPSLPPASGGAGAAAGAGGAGATGAVPMQQPGRGHRRGGSLPESLDWAWMSSQPEGQSVLQRLLRGDWPASIEPHTGSLVSGWAGMHGAARRSPLRSPLRPQRGAAGQGSGGVAGELREPLLEQEEGEEGTQEQQQQQQQQQGLGQGAAAARASSTEEQPGGLAAEASVFTNPSYRLSSAAEQGGGGGGGGPLPAQESSMAASSVFDNPSFLSSTSDREQWQGGRYSTQEAALPLPVLAEEGGERRSGDEEAQGAQEEEEGEEGGVLLEAHAYPSYLADSFDAEAVAAAREAAEQQAAPGGGEGWQEGAWQQQQQEQQQQQQGAAAPAAGEERGEGAPGSAGPSAAGDVWPQPLGLLLLHPDISGRVAPKYARVLAHSRLGRRVLRRLLRAEMGEVTNHRAWAAWHRHLTPDLLTLYRRPLHVWGWDVALIEVARARNDIHSLERAQLLAAVVDAGLPVLVATGECDRMVPPSAISRIAERLGAVAPRLAVVPHCGHLSHEEAPAALLDFVASFVHDLALGG